MKYFLPCSAQIGYNADLLCTYLSEYWKDECEDEPNHKILNIIHLLYIARKLILYENGMDRMLYEKCYYLSNLTYVISLC